MLILPGDFTDILGILMQFSSFGFVLIKPFVKSKFTKNTHNEVIDVEVVEKEIKD